MPSSARRSLIAAVMALAAGAGSGCQSHVVDLVETGAVSMKVHKTEPLHVVDARVAQFPEEVLVAGHVGFRRGRAGVSAGHVDIAVVGADGRTIARRDVDYYPKIIRRKGKRQSRFTCRFPGTLPEGSTVHLRHHRPVRWTCNADFVSSDMK